MSAPSGVINIKAISKLLEKSPTSRKAFTWAIKAILHLLEQQRLIDFRKLEKVSLDWNNGTLTLGDGFTEMLVARAVGEYLIDRKYKRATFIISGEDIKNKHQKENTGRSGQ